MNYALRPGRAPGGRITKADLLVQVPATSSQPARKIAVDFVVTAPRAELRTEEALATAHPRFMADFGVARKHEEVEAKYVITPANRDSFVGGGLDVAGGHSTEFRKFWSDLLTVALGPELARALAADAAADPVAAPFLPVVDPDDATATRLLWRIKARLTTAVLEDNAGVFDAYYTHAAQPAGARSPADVWVPPAAM